MKKWIGLLLCLYAPQGVIAAELHPEELIRQTSEQLLNQIQANAEQYQQSLEKLYTLVDETVSPHFDFDAMVDMALGRYKDKINAKQRPLITNEFKILLVRTYGKALLEYNDQEIIYLPMEGSAEKGDVTVKTEIEQEGGFPLPLNYSLKQSEQGWKVYDISVDEISLVTNYRSSFARQIKRKGVDGLIKTLHDRNQEL